MHSTYLLVDIAALIVPLLFSFHPKIKFYKELKYFFPACLAVAGIFLTWDYFFTKHQVWGFNKDYVSGIYVNILPVEEILFFICIPYACVFTYHCFKVLYPAKTTFKNERIVSPVLVLGLILAGIVFIDKAYTASAFLSCGIIILLLQFVFKVKWLGRFYFTYLFLLLPFFVVNGILTGSGLDAPVVWYDNTENLGIRLLTVPFEDIFYGMLLVLCNIACMEYLKGNNLNS